MRWLRRVWFLTLAAGLFLVGPAQADDPSIEKTIEKTAAEIKPFLAEHCYACHGPKEQEGDIRFDTLKTDLSHIPTLELWQNILDQINLGEMPPKEEPRPTLAEVTPVVDWLTTTLRSVYAKKRSTGGKTVIRRLNRHELRNTLRDLLYLEGASYRPGAVSKLVDNNGNGRVERTGNDPVREFPEDENEDGFVNIGNRLVMSDFLLKLTIAAAEETLQAATHSEKKPNIKTRRFAGHLVKGKQYGQRAIETVSRELNSDFDLMAMGYERHGRLTPQALRGGVGTAARYRITVEASGHNQKHPWGELIKTDQAQPFQLGLNIADMRNGGLAGPTSRSLVLWSLPGDGKKRTFSFETWLDKTWTPWLGWENGPYDRQFRAEKLVQKYLPQSFKPRPDRKKVDKKVFDAWPIEMARTLLKSGYQGPHIRIYSMTVEPLLDAWPPKSHTALYGDGPVEQADVESLFLNFASRAYRRPVTAVEVAPYVKLARRMMKDDTVVASGGVIKDLKFKSYQGQWSKLPEFAKLKPIAEGLLSDGLFDIRAANKKEHFGLVFEGKIEAEKAGAYEFQMASDDGARLIVNGTKLIEHDGLHGPQLRKAKTKLSAGTHAIRLEYFAYGQPNSLKAAWRGPGFSMTPLSVENKSPKRLIASSGSAARAMKAVQAGYTAMLCSPRFLYIKEQGDQLDQYEIATRLSYFLWSSMPDETLLQLASTNKLSDATVLQQQVERMLKDPKAESFMHNFTVAWLRLDKLGKMPPEKSGPFRFYHDRKMEPVMVAQSTAYFADLVNSNGKIEKFIDSDYTFMNAVLGQWIYNRKDIVGDRLRKVALTDPRRGGIFTQPSVMTATANGVDTSPVVRGVWVLENVLGTPPSPPPPDVEPLAPDLRAAKTIREQIQLHRKQDVCNSCHRKIDPMGFAMENFDPVGRWREKYSRARKKIDASATTTTNREMADIVEFKKMLMSKKQLVTRCLTKKMLTYASGRILEPTDRGEIDKIVAKLEAKGNGLRDLIKLVVQSDVFLAR
jgi:hypothetical protein